jgi:hypothetical protein
VSFVLLFFKLVISGQRWTTPDLLIPIVLTGSWVYNPASSIQQKLRETRKHSMLFYDYPQKITTSLCVFRRNCLF